MCFLSNFDVNNAWIQCILIEMIKWYEIAHQTLF